jgi:hypothetical protein
VRAIIQWKSSTWCNWGYAAPSITSWWCIPEPPLASLLEDGRSCSRVFLMAIENEETPINMRQKHYIRAESGRIFVPIQKTCFVGLIMVTDPKTVVEEIRSEKPNTRGFNRIKVKTSWKIRVVRTKLGCRSKLNCKQKQGLFRSESRSLGY